MEMDDNENLIDVSLGFFNFKLFIKCNDFVQTNSNIIAIIAYFFLFQFQKMNFSPFTQFSGLQSSSSLHQFTTAKFAQNLSASNGQVGNMFFLKKSWLC